MRKKIKKLIFKFKLSKNLEIKNLEILLCLQSHLFIKNKFNIFDNLEFNYQINKIWPNIVYTKNQTQIILNNSSQKEKEKKVLLLFMRNSTIIIFLVHEIVLLLFMKNEKEKKKCYSTWPISTPSAELACHFLPPFRPFSLFRRKYKHEKLY
jgi:hypothetical protein